MRIATWNVNGLRARIDFVRHWLKDRQPDVVGLQELKLPDEQFPHEAFRELGYHALTHGQKSWNGVAILSREPAELCRQGLPGQEAAGARLLEAKIGDLRFITVYCPNGRSVDNPEFAQKLAWYDSLASYMAARPLTQDTVLCGDFNICPGALDSYDAVGLMGCIFHTDAERQRFASLLGTGLRDVFREQNPDLSAFSWWDYRAGSFHKNEGLRIDMLLASPNVAGRVKSVEIDREYRKKKLDLTASDHAPVLAELAAC